VDFLHPFDTRLPRSIVNDASGCQQIIKNLLSATPSSSPTRPGDASPSRPAHGGWTPEPRATRPLPSDVLWCSHASTTPASASRATTQKIILRPSSRRRLTAQVRRPPASAWPSARAVACSAAEIRLQSNPAAAATFTLHYLAATYAPAGAQKAPARRGGRAPLSPLHPGRRLPPFSASGRTEGERRAKRNG